MPAPAAAAELGAAAALTGARCKFAAPFVPMLIAWPPDVTVSDDSCVMRRFRPSEATHGPSCAVTAAVGGGKPGDAAAAARAL